MRVENNGMPTKQLILIFLTSTIVFVSAFTFIQFFQLAQTSKRQEEFSNETAGISGAKPEKLEQERLVQVNSMPFNLTYGERTAKWWQWAYSIPKAVNPA